MAIASSYRESVALHKIHRAKVVLCAFPGDGKILKYTWFENQNYILDLETVLKGCQELDHLLLHIPVIMINRMAEWLKANSPLLKKVKNIQLNILLMNIDNIAGKNINDLKRFGMVTSTAAHEAYTNVATREAIGVPLHRLSVSVGPEYYSLATYAEKQPILIVSPDPHPLKEKVLQHIAKACPNLIIRIIENLSYADYRKLARVAKWSLTFGEGLDGYFVEPVFSGGVAFAVFNDRFFTSEFSTLETVYESWEALIARVVADMDRLDDPGAYERAWQPTYNLLAGIYNLDRFRQNLRKFYRGEYTFP